MGLDDNFFDLGGHSLRLLEVQERLARELDREIPLVDLFQFPTVGALARHLAGGAAAVEDAVPIRAAAGVGAGTSDIAVVGMAGRFPRAAGLDELWRNLRDGVEAISFFSDEELTAAGIPPAVLADPRYVKARAVLEDADLFDAAFFGFSPREAELMDPQHRLFLECACRSAGERRLRPAGATRERSACTPARRPSTYLLEQSDRQSRVARRNGQLPDLDR